MLRFLVPIVIRLVADGFGLIVAALVITAWLSDGLQISGTVTWLLATIVVWAASLLVGVLLPAIFVKRTVQEARR